jgi:uncharacterized protein (DUF302 family)
MNESGNTETPQEIDGIVSRPSPFSVEETLGRLQAAMSSRKLTLFAHIDHSGEATQVGLTMQAAHVLIFGNPRGGTPLMIAAPLLALDLPLKILVWQSPDNKVWISCNSVAYLRDRYALPLELTGNLAVIEAVIEQALRD